MESGEGVGTVTSPPPTRPRGANKPTLAPPQPPPAQQRPGIAWPTEADQMVVREKETTLDLPLFEGAIVVYLGPSRRKSIPIRGRIAVEKWESSPGVPEIVKTCVEEDFITSYDFSTHDSRGRLILERLVPAEAAPRLRGKPWQLVEHAEHIRVFLRMRDRNKDREFEVLVPPPDHERFRTYVGDKERSLGKKHALIEYTMKEGR